MKLKLKRVIAVLLIAVLFFSLAAVTVSAGARADVPITVLRAGGGSSGGGSGGSGGSSSHSSHSSTGRHGNSNPYSAIFGLFGFVLISGGATLFYRLMLSKYARNTKKLMKLLQKKDSAWKYKNIQKQVTKAYFAIQKAWTALDMSSARLYMSEDLYQSFETKISWIRYKNQRNVLKRIKLLDAVPVSLHDDVWDTDDHVWFYVKGSMIDYTENVETGERIDGSPIPGSFVEYWQFKRTKDDRWVLNSILQEDEAEGIAFSS